ncbi:class A beta-lactamase [Desulfobacter sp.]|uniref:class A beta-lactamase n=1 Tax=Desulfobacter sp. TaxID=2294 RepID=UPI003D09C0A1
MNSPSCTRRDFLIRVASTLATISALSVASAESEPASLADIETRVGGRVGVFAVDTASGKVLAHRPDERFAMCSTFKWVLAATVFAQVERNLLSLSSRVLYGHADLLAYAPVTSEHAAEGSMTVSDLIRAAIVVSDNTAANLLLSKLGGPSVVTQFARSCGDTVTRLDRNEPTLNENKAGDLRDTTSPRAMATLMRKVLCGNRLLPEYRNLLLQWLRDCETGYDRLRANLPKDWMVGDKTGTGEHGAVNDIAIAIPPDRSPILIAAFLSEGSADRPALVAAHASISLLVRHYFA